MKPITVPAKLLYDLLPYACKNDERYYLNGVFLSKAGAAVASNGEVMCKTQHPKLKELEGDVIVSREFIEFAKKTKADTFNVGSNGVSFAVGDVSEQADFIDGKYPKFNNVIPDREIRPYSFELPDYKTAREWCAKAKVLSKARPTVVLAEGNISLYNPFGDNIVVQTGIDQALKVAFKSEYFALMAKHGGIVHVNGYKDSAVIYGKDSTIVVMPFNVFY